MQMIEELFGMSIEEDLLCNQCYKILPESERKNSNKIVKGVLVLKGWFKIHLNLIYSVNKTFVRIKWLWNNWKREQSGLKSQMRVFLQ